MTKFERLRTRIILAQSVGRSPDSIDVLDKEGKTIYFVNDFKGMNFAFGFTEVPTEDQAREEIKDAYLMCCEVDFDVEFKYNKDVK